MPCPFLNGDKGMGETEIIRKFLRNDQLTFYRGIGVTSMPVVAKEMPTEPVERDVYGELLNAPSARVKVETRPSD